MPLDRHAPMSTEDTPQEVTTGLSARLGVPATVLEQFSAHKAAANERGYELELARFAGDGYLALPAD